MKKISEPEDCTHPCDRQYCWLARREDGKLCLMEVCCCECGSFLLEVDLDARPRRVLRKGFYFKTKGKRNGKT